jgi:hypothetical protein
MDRFTKSDQIVMLLGAFTAGLARKSQAEHWGFKIENG